MEKSKSGRKSAGISTRRIQRSRSGIRTESVRSSNGFAVSLILLLLPAIGCGFTDALATVLVR